MTTYYKATFSDGRVLTRATASRKYSHGWIVCGHYVAKERPEWQTFQRDGFSGREELARKAIDWNYDPSYVGIDFAEFAPAVEIDGKEYRALNKARKEP